MIRQSQTFLKQAIRISDSVVITAAFYLAYALRQDVHSIYRWDMVSQQHVLDPLKDIHSYLWLLLIILPLWIGMLQIMGGYRELRVKSFRRTSGALLKANALSLLFFGSAIFLLKISFVSRTFMAIFFFLSAGLLCLERAVLIQLWRSLARRDFFQRKVLVVGTGRRAQTLIGAIYNRKDWGLHLVGLVDNDPGLVGQEVADTKIIGTLDEIPRIIEEQVIDEVMFAVPRNWMSHIEPTVLHCERVGVRATIAADLFNLNFAKVHAAEIDGLPLISFDATPVDQWQLAIKRIGDVLFAVTALIFLLPFFALAACVIKLTSPGPVFFRQVRIGLNGRQFVLYKFRSMVADAEARQKELQHLNELEGPVFKISNDPRFTTIGKWLRKTSIDELPQLWNVLRGELSLIGPRPAVPQEVSQYEPWQRRRLSMRPGITGHWQVNGRNQIKDFNQWMRLDLEYIDRWSLGFDFRIILKTIPTVLLGTGAK